MSQERRSRGVEPRPATNPDLADSVPNWWDSPALAYIKGLQDGARLAEEEAMAGWPAAVRSAVRLIERAERRELFDRGERAS